MQALPARHGMHRHYLKPLISPKAYDIYIACKFQLPARNGLAVIIPKISACQDLGHRQTG